MTNTVIKNIAKILDFKLFKGLYSVIAHPGGNYISLSNFDCEITHQTDLNCGTYFIDNNIKSEAEIILPTLPIELFKTCNVTLELKTINALSSHMGINDTRQMLNSASIYLDQEYNAIGMAATDAHRLIAIGDCSECSGRFSRNILIPRILLQIALKLKSPLQINGISEHQICGKIGNYGFKTKLIDAKYPDITRVIPLDSNTLIDFNTENVKPIKHTKKNIPFLRFICGNIKLYNPTDSVMFETIIAEYDCEKIQNMWLNHDYIIDALNVLYNVNTLKMHCLSNKGAILINSIDYDKNLQNLNYKIVIMPLNNADKFFKHHDEKQLVTQSLILENTKLENSNIADTPTTPPVSKIIPREWQANTLEALNDAPKEADKTIICAPTGAGKMVFIMLIIQQMLQCNKSVLVLVDRVALVDQLSECATKYGITHNVIQSDNSKLVNSNITIASIQSYFSLATPMASPDVLIIDEAHTMYQSVSTFMKSNTMRVFGLTATPITKGLGNVYNSIINATTAQELTANGSLVGFTPYVMTKIDMTGAKTFAGEFVATDIHQRSAKIYGDVVYGYKQYAFNKRAICFCANTDHCNDVYQQFTNAGIPVGVYTSKTPERERKKLLEQFDNSEIMILISISALSKGFDKPYIECILDLRPLRKSLAEYVQMVGRGLRSCEGKTDCLLLDFSGNWDRFADDFEYLFANGVSSLNDNEYLSRPRSDNAALTTKCPKCGHSMANTCMKCGYEIFKKTKIQNKITVELNNIYAIERNRISIPSPPPPILNNTIWNKLKQMFESKIK